MKTLSISTRTICGIDELQAHGSAGVTHVLSITDPGHPELPAFAAYGDVKRTRLQFHDVIDPGPGLVFPALEHIEAILGFGEELDQSVEEGVDGHLLVHCHMGISRSTAAMLTLMAQGEPDADADELFARLRDIRPRAWPNSVMIGHADVLLGRSGDLNDALARHYAHQIARQPDLIRLIEAGGRGREIASGRSASIG